LTTAEIERIFSAERRVQRMLDFEAALAIAECEAGIVPVVARDAIVACCRADRFDAPQLLDSARTVGNAAIPLVGALTKIVAEQNSSASQWVHWGATSQDVLDTAMFLQLREAVGQIVAQLQATESRLAELALQHLRTPMVARTLLQQATAVTLGYKLAIWGHGIERARMTLQHLDEDAFALQFGGAVGTLSVLGTQAVVVRSVAAKQLGLSAPVITWHTLRDRMTTIGGAMAMAVIACAKLAQDLLLMMQSEVGEAVESENSAGGSSAMPNKRNPVRALVPVAAAANVGGLMAALYNSAVHEHERAAGAWHGEWFALPQLAALAHASACATADIAGSVAFSPERMRQNLDSGGGLVAAEALTAALANVSGKAVARQTVERLCNQVRTGGLNLAELVAATPNLAEQLGAVGMVDVFSHADAIDAAERAAQNWLDQRTI
jgi:3-carboxy-cis,cis-muconate cycloisomerase